MVYQNSPSDRMQLVGMGQMVHPASCMVCGSGNCEEGYVHLGVWYEYEGAMYLCNNCLTQAGEVLGMLTKEEALRNVFMAEDLLDRCNVLTMELDKANERLAIYDSVIRGVAVAVANADDGSGNDVPVVEVELSGEPPVNEPVEDAVTGEPVTEESITVERPSDAGPDEPVDFTSGSNSKSRIKL